MTNAEKRPVGPKHPAKFSKVLLPVFAAALQPLIPAEGGQVSVLDPFAGTGLIHKLRGLGPYRTIGVEIEPEWAKMSPYTYVGNALALQFDKEAFDAIVTSPTYGNRFADKHDAKDGSVRRSYKHDLGRALHETNSGGMQWGEQYREFHRRAWREAVRVLRTDGYFVLNIKDHIRKGERQNVPQWHVETLQALGLVLLRSVNVNTPGMRNGANHDKRVGEEEVHVFVKSPDRQGAH